MSVLARTARLRLRHVEPSDAADFFALSTDPEVLRYTGQAPMRATSEAEALVAELIQRYEDYGYGRWVVERNADGRFLGWCGLRMVEAEGVDLGFWLLREYWGQGYAGEAARASVELGFGEFDLPYLLGRAVSENVASCAALARLGFEPWYCTAGWGYDEIRYSILRRPDSAVAAPALDVVCREGPLTARLLQDADQLDFFMLEGNPNVLRYADGERLDFEGAGRAIANLRRTARDPKSPLRVFAVSDPARPFVGTVALVDEGEAVEIGCRLLESEQGRGLGRPLTALALAMARQERPAARIIARVDLRNDRALRMVEGLGATRGPDRDGHAHYAWAPTT